MPALTLALALALVGITKGREQKQGMKNWWTGIEVPPCAASYFASMR